MRKTIFTAAVLLAFCRHACVTVRGADGNTPDSSATTQPSSRPETLSDMLKGVRVVGTSVIFDNARFNALLDKRIADPNGWPEIAVALGAPNADILYFRLRREPISQRQAFYEWALTKGNIKDKSALTMIAECLAETTRRSTSDAVFALADVKEPSLLAVWAASAFTQSRTKDVQKIMERWETVIMNLGYEIIGDSDMTMMVKQYINALAGLETPAADTLLCKLIKKYYLHGDFVEVRAAIENLGKRKVAGAFETIRNVAVTKGEWEMRVTAVEALASIAATAEERSQAAALLSKVMTAVGASEGPQEEIKRRLEVVANNLRKHAESRPKDE